MPDPWYPGAERRPGRNAGYAAGRNTMQAAVAHYTVGRDSSGPAYLGYLFQFLITRDGRVLQGAECDAVCYHAGYPWNGLGPGLEVEYHPSYDDAVFTPEADAATAQLLAWLNTEWGVPLDYYDGPRITDWNGVIAHGSLIQSGDAHFDSWPYLPTVAAPLPPPEPPKKVTIMPPILLQETGKAEVWLYDIYSGTARQVYADELATLSGTIANHGFNGAVQEDTGGLLVHATRIPAT